MIRKMLFVSTLAIVIVMVLMASTAFASPWIGTPGEEIEIIISPSGDKTKPGATGIQVVIFWTEGVVAPTEIDVNIGGITAPTD